MRQSLENCTAQLRGQDGSQNEQADLERAFSEFLSDKWLRLVPPLDYPASLWLQIWPGSSPLAFPTACS